MEKNKNVLLIGITGCGKTTFGQLLSEKLNYNFIDMDNYIETISKDTITELFEKGEDNFRNWETKACEKLSMSINTIISSGGGVIKRPINMEFFKEKALIIFIDRPVENIINDIDISKRPLLKDNKEVLYKLKEERYELYNKYCDYRIENIGDLDTVLSNLINIIKNI